MKIFKKIIDIWYKGSVQAHHFIDASYWESKMQEMKDKYIPMSETHVITDQSEIIGFISMVGNYLAALFIDVRNQNNGAGRELLNFEKKATEYHAAESISGKCISYKLLFEKWLCFEG